MCYSVDVSSVYHGSVEEFGVLFPFLEPLNSRFMSPKYLLLPPLASYVSQVAPVIALLPA
jgi:hypothetical protein